MKKILSFLLIFNSFTLFSATITWNLNSTYGVTQSGFSAILLDAKNHFANNPDDIVIISIDAGTYNIGGNGSYGIYINAITPGANGKLLIKGAGMNNTTLVFTETSQQMLRIQNSNNIEFLDMHMTKLNYTVTQGIVQNIGTGYIDLNLQAGFPTPLEIFDSTSDSGRYLRRYTTSLSDPQVIQTDNEQIAWGWVNSVIKFPELISGSTWRFYLNDKTLVASNYSEGELVGVKSKHEGETYFINGGSNFLFENVKWTHSTRGVTRNGTSNLVFKNCRIERAAAINGQTPCLSSPSGGFQMNQPADAVSTNMIVENCFIDSTGDDCVAFFNVNNCKLINSTLRNSFARGVYIIPTAQNVCFTNNNIENSPIEGPYTYCSIPVSSISLNSSAISLNIATTNQLTATVAPLDATNKTITWTSSNPAVATVSGTGLVSSITAGTATITATTQDGNKFAMCTVIVTAPDTNILPANLTTSYFQIVNQGTGDYLKATSTSTTAYGVIIQEAQTTPPPASWGSFQWRLPNSGFTGFNHIYNKSTGKNFRPASASQAAGINLQQVSKATALYSSESWEIIASTVSGYYYIKNKASGLYLHPTASSQTSGKQIVQDALNATDSTFRWKFINMGAAKIETEKISIAAEEDSKSKSLVIYPNPASSVLNLSVDTNWEFINVSGGILLKGKGKEIDVSKIPNGVYFVKTPSGTMCSIINK